MKENSYLLHKTIYPLRNCPEAAQRAARWFHRQWDIPQVAYEESIYQSIQSAEAVPQWYIMLDENQEIIAGVGVIENDYHPRKDLAPNLCALYVEEAYRGQGIGGMLLEFVRADMAQLGVKTLYLLTDHIGFYEGYGWEFITMVTGEDGKEARVYRVDTD